MGKTKYDPDTFPELAEGYARQGMIDTEISAKLGISHETFYNYQEKYVEFSEAIKRGKRPVNFLVEKALLKRCLGFEDVEEDKETKKDNNGEKVLYKKTRTKNVIPDVAACFIWLKNRDPDRWRDKHEVDANITNNVGRLFEEEEEEKDEK